MMRNNEKGLTLLEVIVALGLLGIIVIAFLSALSAASLAMFVADERATAESLARTQMEYVKNQDYDDSGAYDEIDEDDIPDGYDIELFSEELQTGLQKITVIVYHNGEPVITSGNFTLEDYKVNR